MKKNKIIVYMLLIIMLTNIFQLNGHCSNHKYLHYYRGEVLEIIDGEIIKVKIYNPQLGYEVWDVKLLGVKTNASQEAYEYVYSNILNTKITLKTERLYSNDNYLKYGYMYYGEGKNFLNEELLRLGLAELDTDDKYSSLFSDLKSDYEFAKNNCKGIFEEEDYYYENGLKININLATKSELDDYLEDVDYDLAREIVNYRTYNNFNTIDELKFVNSEIDAEWFKKNKNDIGVVTNINKAEEQELLSVFDYKEDSIVDDILDYREDDYFEEIDDIRHISGVSSKVFRHIKDFIDIKYTKELIEPDLKKVNINTASHDQLRKIEHMTSSQASSIVKYRDNDRYSYKNIEDILKLQSYSSHYFDRYCDNISLYTDINKAGKTELESLTQKEELTKKIIDERPFDDKATLLIIIPELRSVADYIYIDELKEKTKININLATKKVLEDELELTKTEISYLRKYNRKYYNYIDLQKNISRVNMQITLFTNINTATQEELKLLNENIDTDIAEDIIEYRDTQRFTTRTELKDFFKDIDEEEIYRDINGFIVFR